MPAGYFPPKETYPVDFMLLGIQDFINVKKTLKELPKTLQNFEDLQKPPRNSHPLPIPIPTPASDRIVRGRFCVISKFTLRSEIRIVL